VFLIVAVGLPLSIEAHNGCPRHRRYSRTTAYRSYNRSYNRGYNRSYSPRYGTAAYVAERRPSFYRRHRNLINMGIASGAGALLGGLLGGRRGVAYGLLGGAGAGALYTYKLNPKRRYYRSY
jgi:hypothetical protein